MRRRWPILLALVVGAGLAAAAALPSAPPVGPLPKGPTESVRLKPGATFTAKLPKPSAAGRVWRVARAFDGGVVREVGERTTAGGATWVRFRAAGGKTRVVFALTRGETAHAYATRTYVVVISARTPAAGCPKGLLPFAANPVGPSVIAALVADKPENRPQVTGAMIAPKDESRGPEVKKQCGEKVWQRTVVYITDRALLPSQSLSERVVFVGRTSAGYRVWKRAH